ncbi:hypothetical protein RV11_GL003111 [Enterococcus phoeniculicola]|nr:hypothetical protein RV11_GL003111 [Enterococcus phoeniculicola]
MEKMENQRKFYIFSHSYFLIRFFSFYYRKKWKLIQELTWKHFSIMLYFRKTKRC